MNTAYKVGFRWVMAVGISACLCSLSAGTIKAQASSGKVVPLTPGSCAQISYGDVLSFEWNPVFDNPSAGQMVRRFQLDFAKREEMPRLARIGPSLVLEANPKLHGEVPNQPGSEITPTANGYFQFRFHVRLTGVAPGTYYLVGAQSDPVLENGHTGPIPRMTNNPMRYPFCLDVADQPRHDAKPH